jgi:methylenetetrahydrofolate reductase (NADPH)
MNKVSIQNLVRNYTIETTVPQAERVEKFSDIVPAGTRLYIAHIPGTNPKDTAALAGRLRREGMEPVPHIVGRRIKSLADLEEVLARLTGEAGVKQVLVVAGDNAQPEGELTSGLQVIESGLLDKYNIKTFGVAGHPEGHREVADPVLRDALRRKNAYADKTGANVYVVTQFAFTAEPVIAWEKSYTADIGKLPVTVGLPGLATAKTLLKYAMDCGVGASLAAFSKQYASLTKLLTVSAPDEAIVQFATYKEANPQSHINAFHFFPFGGFKKTADWANKIVAGNFEVTSDGGLKVQ